MLSERQTRIRGRCAGCAEEVPVLVHSGVCDGQRHHGHAVHVVRYTLWFIYVPVHPSRPWDPLQETTTTNLLMNLY